MLRMPSASQQVLRGAQRVAMLCALGTTLLLGCGSSERSDMVPAVSPGTAALSPGNVLVRVPKLLGAAEREQLELTFMLSEVAVYETSPEPIYVFAINDGMEPPAKADAVSRDPHVCATSPLLPGPSIDTQIQTFADQRFCRRSRWDGSLMGLAAIGGASAGGGLLVIALLRNVPAKPDRRRPGRRGLR